MLWQIFLLAHTINEVTSFNTSVHVVSSGTNLFACPCLILLLYVYRLGKLAIILLLISTVM
jgi:hypothetical protein